MLLHLVGYLHRFLFKLMAPNKITVMVYCTPDDGRDGRPKHVE